MGTPKMILESKYSLVQDIYPIYRNGDTWNVGPRTQIKRICFRVNIGSPDVSYSTSNRSNAIPEELIFLKEVSAQNECNKRNIIQELIK